MSIISNMAFRTSLILNLKQPSDDLTGRCAVSDAQVATATRHFKRARKAERYRSGKAGRKDSGAPTPAGVGLDDLIQKFADDQHGKGLIHTSRHSNLAGQSVQYGRT
ncbi:hypothetical protein [Pseudomonas sp. BW7P1]|uniref:hypothetical protein n=1 Tax=Pseudomonas TaxID=286 RepID=UPI0021ADC9F8|nr:hypothetical protein [Pseudomonas sp. BW7P1]UWI61436.1 hypothetical protein NWV16_25730 [Pseudomonas sp. BW7P1]